MDNEFDCAASCFAATLFAAAFLACVFAAAQEAFRDEFAGFEHVHARRNMALVRQYPRVPNEPDVRINPRDPAHYKYKDRAAGLGWFPWICRLQNGELIVLYRESAAHGVSPCGRVALSRSKDGGRTWSAPTVVLDRPGRDDREMLATQTSDGAIWAGAPMLKSTDNGRTWQRPLSEERRKQIASQAKTLAEEAKVAIRNIRRDANKEIDKEQKDKLCSEDEAYGAKEEVQDLTKQYEEKVAEMLKKKEAEIMEI